jgi:ketosteroid isomerase-like protein
MFLCNLKKLKYKHMKKLLFTAILPAFLFSCKPDKQKLINEIYKVENDFAISAKNDGVNAAFLKFADENAVILRSDIILKGKPEIKKYMDSSKATDVKLEWKPDFVEVSLSGDLAYTYGKYTFSGKNSSGEIISDSGIFHTVWKKQKDGTWKFVWD